MPHPFRVTATNSSTGESEKLEGAFSDADWGILSNYLTCARRLAECRIVESQSQLKLQIHGDKGQPTTHSVSLPPEDPTSAFLHRLRPFILKKERTNFYKVRKLLARHLALPSVRRVLDRLADRYSGKMMAFELTVGSRSGRDVLNREESILRWLNAFEYHQDDKKQAHMRDVFSVMPENVARAVFLYSLLECAGAIGQLGAIIDGLTQRNGREVQIR